MNNNQEQNLQINVIIRYGMVGLLGTAIHFFMTILLVELVHLDPVMGSALGFLLVLVVSYVLNRKWTFQSRGRRKRQFLIYSIVSSIGLVINISIIFISVHVLKWNYIYGQCLVVVVVPVSNYLLNSSWTFRNANKEL